MSELEAKGPLNIHIDSYLPSYKISLPDRKFEKTIFHYPQNT